MQNVSAILLDIEGTVAPISFVHEVLFPYARREMRNFLSTNWNDPAVIQARDLLMGTVEHAVDSVTHRAHALMDGDVKDTGLKQLQGLIWEQGYRAGAFQSPVYDDVPRALRRWTTAGKTVAVYSSGSVAAQKVFFQHTNAGDLTPLLTSHFDTTTGPKKSSSSYCAIALTLGFSTDQMLFITDIEDEAIAAAAAGMRAMIALRPGNAPVRSNAFEVVTSFDDVVPHDAG